MKNILIELKKEVKATAELLGEPEEHIYYELIGFCAGRRTGKLAEEYQKSKEKKN